MVRGAQQPEHLLLLSRKEKRWPRRCAIGAFSFITVIALAVGGLWWRLSSGPMSLDVFTPFLTSALEDRVGGGRRVEVGGTVLERDEDGRTAVRLHDVVVRDAEGTIVASAPKAEVGLAGGGLLTGSLRAARINLIGAEMGVRIETDGRLTVFTGTSGDRPIASVPAAPQAPVAAPVQGSPSANPAETPAAGPSDAIVAWLKSLDTNGLDGGDLAEIGLKSGNLSIDDRRTGKHVVFENINFKLKRLAAGGVALEVSSLGADGQWSLNASMTPNADGTRALDLKLRDVSPKDILLALRLNHSDFQADVPVSADIKAQFSADGVPQMITGRVIAGAGFIGDTKDDLARVRIDEMQAELRWDANARALIVPLEVLAGANRVGFQAVIEPPRERGGIWALSVMQGGASLSTAGAKEPPVVVDRVALRATLDPVAKRLTLQQGDLAGRNVGATLMAALDYSGSEPYLRFSVTGGRMPLNALKRLWPVFIVPEVRNWVDEQILAGTIEKVAIMGDAPLAAFKPGGEPLRPEQLKIEIVAKNAVVQPLDALPALKDVDITTKIIGSTTSITFGKGTIELASGRKLTVPGGTFEIADTSKRPAMSQSRLRIEGPLDAVAEMLSLEALKDSSSLPLDAATTKGNVVAQMALAIPMLKVVTRNDVGYGVEAEITGFTAEKFFRNLKAENGTLRISATHDGMLVKGDARIGGAPSTLEYKTARNQTDAEVRVQATLDDNARSRLGIDLPGISGPVPVKFNGRMKLATREGKFGFDVDLTQARITDLAGWNKAPGRAAKSSFTLIDRGQSVRLEDFVLEGGGASLRGAIEIDAQGDLMSANLPTFAMNEGDKASLRIDRANDGTMRVTLRGDVIDGRGLVKASVSGKETSKGKKSTDFDVDVKVGVITGHHGEALRSLELKMSRRNGQIRTFAVNGKLGTNAQIKGVMRSRGSGQAMYIECSDAGALFRFADIYPKIVGGVMDVAMEAPSDDGAPRDGLLNVRDFAVRGESALDGVAASSVDPTGAGARNRGGGVPFSRMRAEFTRSPGKFSVREGVVWGPSIGATVDGSLDYATNAVSLRGTFIPAYGLNNMVARVPVLGMFLGGGANEGLLGVTYQVVGTPNKPVLQVNPMSAVAPGFLRKLFEYRRNDGGGTTGRAEE
jgi:hypothetical protein